MEIKRVGSQPSAKGPAEYLLGTVRVDPRFQVLDPARAVGASVRFEPGARTAWHPHPLGQTLCDGGLIAVRKNQPRRRTNCAIGWLGKASTSSYFP